MSPLLFRFGFLFLTWRKQSRIEARLSDINAALKRQPNVHLLGQRPYAELPRAFRARVDGVDVKGDPVTIETTGMAARCLQHEVNHLNGTVYVDLLPEAQREQLLAEAAGPGGDLPA